MTQLPVHQSEEELQAAVVQRLTHLGYKVYEFGKPGAHRRLGGILPEGWPDLLIIHLARDPKSGAHTYIELKIPGEGLSPKQKRLHAELTTLGCYVITAYTFEQAIDWVESRQRALEEKREVTCVE